MARRVVRRAPSRGRGARPGGTWARTRFQQAGIAAGTKLFLGQFALSNPGIGETIRRTIGHINFASDQVAAAEGPDAAFGMIVVSAAAAAIGITAIPGPITDSSDDGWFVWQAMDTFQGADSNKMSTLFPFDSRAMRRIEEGFVVAMMVETGVGFGSISTVSVSLYATRH